jgi:23S rRNA (cytosine1962-C5)-methyltransferase
VNLISHQGEWLAKAAYSPHSQIRARVWTWDEEESIDQNFFTRSLETAAKLRSSYEVAGIDAYRIVHAESDGLPGLVVDRYGAWLSVQFLTAGVEYWRESILTAIKEVFDLENIYERSDSQARSLEGLKRRAGPIQGEGNPTAIIIHEQEFTFEVDLVHGQKTGFYLDQRENRKLLRDRHASGEVLNVFAYTGGFTIAALMGGATGVLSLDSSRAAIEQAKRNLSLNHLSTKDCHWMIGDAFQSLRTYDSQGRRFDTIYLDPPRFAATSAQAHRAARGYKDINRLALKLLNPGGTLVTFSCSGGISIDLFQKIVADAALDAKREGKIIQSLAQPGDHPIRLGFPEGRYLKGLVVKVA